MTLRRTPQLLKVAAALLETPTAQHWGYDLQRRTSLRSGILYPILARMLEAGWLRDGWEDPRKIEGKRPPRRYYEITDLGAAELGALPSPAPSPSRARPWVRTVRAT